VTATPEAPAVQRAVGEARPVRVEAPRRDPPGEAVGRNPTVRAEGRDANAAAGVEVGPTRVPVDQTRPRAAAVPKVPGPGRRTGRARRPESRRGSVRRRPHRRRRPPDCAGRSTVSRPPAGAAPWAAVPAPRRESGLPARPFGARIDRRSWCLQ